MILKPLPSVQNLIENKFNIQIVTKTSILKQNTWVQICFSTPLMLNFSIFTTSQ